MKIMDIWFVAMQVVCIVMACVTDNFDRISCLVMAIWLFKVNEYGGENKNEKLQKKADS